MADTTIVTNELAHPTYQVDGSGNKITAINPLNAIDIIGSAVAGTNNPYPLVVSGDLNERRAATYN